MGRTACIHVCRKHVKYSLRDVFVDSVAHLNLRTTVCHYSMKQNEKIMTNKDGSIVVKHIMSVEKTKLTILSYTLQPTALEYLVHGKSH